MQRARISTRNKSTRDRVSMTAPTAAAPLAPGRWPVVGHIPPLVRRRHEFMQSLRTGGEVVEIHLGPRTAYVVNAPDLLHRILVTEARSVERGRMFDKLRQFVGNGIGTSDGEHHLRQRRLMQPAFHRERFSRYADLIRSEALDMVESWRPGECVAVDRQMQNLTLTAATRTLFSTHLSAKDTTVIRQSLPILIRGALWRTVLPLDVLELLPTPGNRRFAAARVRLRQTLDSLIATYRADGVDHHDLLSTLLLAREAETGRPMTDSQVRDEAMSVLTAGSETPGHTLTNIFYELGRNPDVNARLCTELANVLGDRPIEFDDIAKLTYTSRIIKETLRLHTPLWLLMRRTKDPVQLGAYAIPAGADVLFSPNALHRDSRWYPNPLRFDPDRWLSDDLPREAYLPFLIGPHRCIGEHFALMELTVVIATVVRGWRLRPYSESREVADLLVHLDTLLMVAERRRPQDPL